MKRRAWFLGGLLLGSAQLVSMVAISCSGVEPIDGSGGSTGGNVDGDGGSDGPTGGRSGGTGGTIDEVCPDPPHIECVGPCFFGCLSPGETCAELNAACEGLGGFGGFGGVGGLGGLGGDAP
jgi:hypothetical protein